MTSANEQYMSIADALLPGPESKSFEEVRMEDYIKAYQNTGRPPFPVLQEPTDELQRKALNLPSLFQPQNPRTLGASSSSSPFKPPAIVTNTEKIVDPVKLPAGQEFRLHSSSDEKYATITCLPMYEGFSVEELRFYAYALGNKTSPTPITMDPFVQVVKEPTTGPLFGSTPTTTTAGASEDKLQSLCAQPEYSRHSPEELRVAYLLNGREMTSAELLPPPSSALSLLIPSPAPTLHLIRAPTAVPTFTFGS